MTNRKLNTARQNISVARILQWEWVENDVTFDHTLYTGADPESFSGGM